MKRKYVVPEISIVEYEVEDIVTSSLLNNGTNSESGNDDTEIDFNDIFGGTP